MTKVVTYIEIDVPYCALSYGTSPCVAALGTTGDAKCFNTLRTCQDPANFDNAPVTLRFAMEGCDYLPRDVFALPCVQSVSMSPGVVSLGKNLGERATLTVTLKDFPSSDTGPAGDKYIAERGYDAFKQGTYWGKFRARQPYVRGRALRWVRGTVNGGAFVATETRHYVIDSFDGPRPDGTFALVAKDVLKLASNDRAVAPKLSNGRLGASITNVATSFTLLPVGVGNLEYPTSGWMSLSGKETVAFTRAGDTVTLTARAQWGSTAVAHSAGGRAQVCLHVNGEDPADIIRDLLVDFAGVEPAFIPLDAWKLSTSTYLGNVYTSLICEPTGVETLCSEIIEQAGLVVGWDDVAQQIKLDVLRNVLPTAAKFSERNILPDSLTVREQPDKRLSQVVIYFGMRNPLESLDNPDNYQCTELVAALESEGYYGSSAIHTIYSRWISFPSRAVATRLGSILLARFQNPPRKIGFSVFREGVGISPAPIGGYRVEYAGGQDMFGAREQVPVQVTKLNPKAEAIDVEAEEIIFAGVDPGDVTDRVVILDSDQYDLFLPALHNTNYAPVTPQDVLDGVNLTVLVQAGTTIGGATAGTSGFALRIGATGTDWPPGFPIKLVVAGRLRGRAGNGGNGADASGYNAGAGQAGGSALHTRHPVTVELLASGQIKGGGGGGGGGANLVYIPAYNKYARYAPGGGGGGGGGALSGVGGTRGGGNFPGGNGGAGTVDAGGAGGAPGTGQLSSTGAAVPGSGIAGGAGGAPGQAGTAGGSYTAFGPYPPGNEQRNASAGGAGGAAGRAIDGVSFCTFAINAGQRAGPEVN
ncbi:hypothetical protein APY04_0161 [Hyphomicrobium sulfonivorans]|uniref:Uncharacterized protein n=1 Tax=Hyphomicrobium sulfonivorans TaxID=121290 RepID=A0A109BP41_HYPSL|nr:hypothetical protein [Hyphomicrobium sulfonivorans]KWT72367.1 hypothetical protein APY04_0161 [Hyphomicrobium sulfonivorans]